MSIPSWAVRGAKVVCIHPGRWMSAFTGKTSQHQPVFGATYTIRGAALDDLGLAMLFFAELPPRQGYHAVHFRPLVNDTIERDLFLSKGLDTRLPQPVEALGGPLANPALLSRPAPHGVTRYANQGSEGREQWDCPIQTMRLSA